MRIFLTMVLLMSAIALSLANVCEADYRGERQERKRVDLLRPTEEPAYYFRVSHYAVLIPANRLVAYLERSNSGSLSSERLLIELKNDPVVSRTDLFKYVLKDARYLQVIEHLVADLLERGNAALLDVWEWTERENIVPFITVITSFGDHAYEGRGFCTPSKDVLLEITDSIA